METLSFYIFSCANCTWLPFVWKWVWKCTLKTKAVIVASMRDWQGFEKDQLWLIFIPSHFLSSEFRRKTFSASCLLLPCVSTKWNYLFPEKRLNENTEYKWLWTGQKFFMFFFLLDPLLKLTSWVSEYIYVLAREHVTG